MLEPVLEAGVGFVAGVLSGAFGVGGGIVTTPAIRLLLGYPELIAVGTPLLVIIPTAVAGATSYFHRGLVNLRAGLVIGCAGIPGTLLGATGSAQAGGRVVLLLTAVIIFLIALDSVRGIFWSTEDRGTAPSSGFRFGDRGLVLLGLGAGVFSGFFGIGGGFIIVPALMRLFGFPIKTAVGTSLVVVGLLAVPGSAIHFYFGHVDLMLAAALAVGVVPGAILGARLTAIASDRAVRIGFAVLLSVTAFWLAIHELATLS
ncbi:MAG: sulfite exporter TauE/SafE family protein [Coriobacteriia bacterium]|nr:sulfite exporter TauE/SafE family protein [Coriobacteriia bacterium]